MKKTLLIAFIAMSCQIGYTQTQVITTGNNIIDPTSPYVADVVVGSDVGTRHDGSMMWWSTASASRISNSNDVFYMSVWDTTTPNVALSAIVGGSSYFQGNVGIGTTSPDAKLTVNGTIHSTEVLVDLSVPAPDYVFEKNYKLKSLPEIGRYIAVNKHLPEIPSAKVMEKDGVNLSEMNMKLLKKVEELTLYLLDKDKQLRAQQKELDHLKRKLKTNQSFQSQLDDLKHQLNGQLSQRINKNN